MDSVSIEQIKEIAGQLDCGLRCYWNKKDGELIFIPDTINHPEMNIEAWFDEIEKLDNNFSDYFEIEPLKPSDSFQIMEDFAYTLSDKNKLKRQLFDALTKRKPFREFKFIIDNSGEYREQWFDFKAQELQKWVREKFKENNVISGA